MPRPRGNKVAYKGWLWNRTDKDVKWAFFENFDNAAMVKVDGKKVLDDGEYRSTTSAAEGIRQWIVTKL